MAAAAGTALLRSVASKMRGMTAAPGARLSGGRRSAPTASRRPFCSSSRPSAVDNKDPSQNKNVPGQDPSQNKNVSGQLHRAKSAPMSAQTKFLCLNMLGSSVFLYGWLKPKLEAMRDEITTLRRERSILMKAVKECQMRHNIARDDSIDPSHQAQVMQALGQGKESGGAS